MTKQNSLTLGSLFDGIGGFPYAASFYGIKTLWASEILSTAVSVTSRHFPDIEHVGDITQLDGAKLPPVDIITFGSPCQGLSMAGKRLGLADERSGLFSEAIRIIREMQEATNGQYPKIALWENVPGALSTAGGRDFRAVIEAFTAAKVPMPESGKWANAGMVRSGSVDIAWCVYNAQYFGVAQRRRRIFLIADFTGRRASEILFVPKSLRRYFEAGGTPRQAAAAYAERGAGSADEQPGVGFDGYNGSLTGDQAATLGVNCGMSTGRNGVVQNCLNGWDTQQSRVYTEDGQAPTLAGADGGGGRNPAGLVYAAFNGGAAPSAGNIGYSESVSPTLRGASGSSMAPCVCEPELARTLMARGDSSPCADRGQNIVAVRQEADGVYPINTQLATCSNKLGEGTGLGIGENGDPAYTLQESHSHAVAYAPDQVLCAATGQANAEILVDKSATIVAGHSQPYIARASDSTEPPGINGNVAGTLDASYHKGTGARSGKEREVVLCRASGQSNAEQLENLSATLNCGAEQPIIAHEKDGGSDEQALAAYGFDLQQITSKQNRSTLREVQPSLCKTSNSHVVAVHPNVSGTLCGSGAGLSRTAGMASETDLCVVHEAIPIHDRATRCSGGGSTRKDDGSGNGLGVGKSGDPAPTITAGDRHAIAAVDCRNLKEVGDLSGTLQSKTTPGYSLNYQNPVRILYIVRRLTPTECERLQGYPDGWTLYSLDGKLISDTKRYQMLGNSIAVPCAAYIMEGIVTALLPERR